MIGDVLLFLLNHLDLLSFLKSSIEQGKLDKERAMAALKAEVGKVSDAEINNEFPLGRA